MEFQNCADKFCNKRIHRQIINNMYKGVISDGVTLADRVYNSEVC